MQYVKHVTTTGEGRSKYTYTTHVTIWDSVSEQVRAMELALTRRREGLGGRHIPELGNPFSVTKGRRGEGNRTTWFGRDDIKNWAALRAAVDGDWDKGMRLVAEMQEEIAKSPFATPRSIRRRPEWNNDTGDFDLGRFEDGKTPWRAGARREVLGQQFVTMLVDIGANCDTSADRSMWRATAAATAAAILEEQGYGAEIIAYHYGRSALKRHGSGWRVDRNSAGEEYLSEVRPDSYYSEDEGYADQNVLCATWIKRADQPLDMSALVNATAPWYFRTVGFVNICTIPAEWPNYGLGYASKAPAELVPYLTPDDGYFQVDEAWDRDSAIRQVQKILRPFCDPDAFDRAAEEVGAFGE